MEVQYLVVYFEKIVVYLKNKTNSPKSKLRTICGNYLPSAGQLGNYFWKIQSIKRSFK